MAREFLFSQGTNEKAASFLERPSRFSVLNDALWHAFGALKLDRHYPRFLAVHFTRKKGATQVWSSYDGRAREYVVNKVILDSARSNAESLRRVNRLLQDVHAHAKTLGARTLRTDYTIIAPRMAERHGFQVTGTSRGLDGKTLYQYAKRLTS